MDQETKLESVCHCEDDQEMSGDGQLLKEQCENLFEQARTMFSLARLYLLKTITYERNHILVKRDPDVVAALFTKVDIELLSPAFLTPLSIASGFSKGTTSPTSDTDLRRFLLSLAARNDWLTYRTLDIQSEYGRDFPSVYLSCSPKPSHPAGSASRKLRIWIQAAVHGNEPAGYQSVLALLGEMDARQSWTMSLLAKMDILILPCYNPDGVARFERTLMSGLDANRDHIKFAAQHTRDIKQIFNTFSPHLAIDMHEYSATFPYADKYRKASDGLFAAAKNLNIHSDIRQLAENLFAPAIARDLEERGLRQGSYVTGETKDSIIILKEACTDAKIGRNAMGLTQCVSFLTETRGIGIADQHFHRRTAASLTMVKSLLQTAADHATDVLHTIQESIVDFISRKDDIIVTDLPVLQSRDFPMVNCQTGLLEDVPVRFFGTTPTIPKITRSRPKAYLIPRSCTDLATRLCDFGLEVITLQHTFRGIVEVYNVVSATIEDTYHEGIVPVNVSTQIADQEIELEPGAYWISTAQKNAALAFVALEPENVDSWVRFNIIPTGAGDQLPYFRVRHQT